MLDQSIALFERLRSANAPGFQVLPSLGGRLQMLKDQEASYAIHEYLNEHWQPLWHSEVARLFAKAGLGFVGSATIADNLLPDILGPQLRSAIVEQPTDELRQDVQDFAINQSFRRDIFCRDPVKAKDQPDHSPSTPLCLLSAPESGGNVTVQTSFGTATLDQRVYGPIIDTLAKQPMSIDELAARHGSSVREMRQIVLLLIQANAIAMVAASSRTSDVAQRINAVIARAVCAGAPYEHVAAAALGTATRVTQLEMMLIDSWLGLEDKGDVAALATAVGQRLNKLGQELYHQGQVVNGADAAAQLEALATAFMTVHLPQRRKQGVLE